MRRNITLKALSVAVVGLVAFSGLAAAQEPPRTGWGAPDLQGVWDFRTLTPLERPEELGDKAFLTPEEAAQREQEEFDRNLELWERDARRAEAGDNVGAYNNFWMDRGTSVVETHRTSLIVDPPNGRLPEMTEPGAETERPRFVHGRVSRELYRPEHLRPLYPGLQRRAADYAWWLQPERADLPDA